jgi:hypothetical protein
MNLLCRFLLFNFMSNYTLFCNILLFYALLSACINQEKHKLLI